MVTHDKVIKKLRRARAHLAALLLMVFVLNAVPSEVALAFDEQANAALDRVSELVRKHLAPDTPLPLTGAPPSDKPAGAAGPAKKPSAVGSQVVGDPGQQAAKVRFVRLCPRSLTMYAPETYTLVPLPLDLNRQPVTAPAMTWQTDNAKVAVVTSSGEVDAIAPGNARISLQIGKVNVIVSVEVRSGARIKQTDADWDKQHGHDCDSPESIGLFSPEPQNDAIPPPWLPAGLARALAMTARPDQRKALNVHSPRPKRSLPRRRGTVLPCGLRNRGWGTPGSSCDPPRFTALPGTRRAALASVPEKGVRRLSGLPRAAPCFKVVTPIFSPKHFG
jgi:hypothetical protein